MKNKHNIRRDVCHLFWWHVSAVLLSAAAIMLCGCEGGQTGLAKTESKKETASSMMADEGDAGGRTGMPNPWENTTAQGMADAIGICMQAPKGAENVGFRMLEEEGLGEMDFSMGGNEYCYRICPSGEMTDISGMFYSWDEEDDIKVSYCPAKYKRVKTEEETIDLVIWYDEVPGLAYSLSAHAEDPDGLDIRAAAELVFVPAQGDS